MAHEKTLAGARRSGVRIIDGPFTGFRGEVKEVGDRSAKVTVQVYWPRYLGGPVIWAGRIGARKFKLKHYTAWTLLVFRAAPL